jgi:hypothetical protein
VVETVTFLSATTPAAVGLDGFLWKVATDPVERSSKTFRLAYITWSVKTAGTVNSSIKIQRFEDNGAVATDLATATLTAGDTDQEFDVWASDYQVSSGQKLGLYVTTLGDALEWTVTVYMVEV